MSHWHGGKGSAPRKNQDQKAYEDGWDRIFGNKGNKQDSRDEGNSNQGRTEDDARKGSTDSNFPKT